MNVFLFKYALHNPQSTAVGGGRCPGHLEGRGGWGLVASSTHAQVQHCQTEKHHSNICICNPDIHRLSIRHLGILHIGSGIGCTL